MRNVATPTVPVLEVGGTHVTAAVVRFDDGEPLVLTAHREPVAADGRADETTAAFLRCARALPTTPPARWGVALPGPFDYVNGIALYHGVGKFDSLHGADLGALLRAGLPACTGVTFLNDAEAFLRGEWTYGAARGHDRAVGITLGTGVGSAFLLRGQAVTDGPTVPPQGRADLLRHLGRPLEDWVSRRALIRAYQQASEHRLDVQQIAEAARNGDGPAARVLERAFVVLGRTLAPWLLRFGATALVVGGSMSRSWDLIGPALQTGLAAEPAPLSIPAPVPARWLEEAALIGAASYAYGPLG